MQLKALALLVAGLALLARPTAADQCNYIIEKGDDLYSLGEQFGSNETELQKLNPFITNKDLIYEGDVIRVPCDGGDATSGDNILDLLLQRKDTYILLQAIAAVDLQGDLDNGNYDATLFAPTDKAFADLLKALKVTRAQLLNDTELVKQVLEYHIIGGKSLTASKLKNKAYKTLLGKEITIEKTDAGVFVLTVAGQRVPVKVADLQAGDATVHLIDSVLLPLEAEAPAGAPATPATPTTPATPAPTAGPVDPNACTYTVAEGDSLFDISQRLGTTLEELLKLNPKIEDPELIFPGDVINVKECPAGGQ